MIQAFGEVQAAYMAGFSRWRDFLRARRMGQFPRPDLQNPDRWSETTLRRWIDGTMAAPDLAAEEQRLIRRLENAAASRS